MGLTTGGLDGVIGDGRDDLLCDCRDHRLSLVVSQRRLQEIAGCLKMQAPAPLSRDYLHRGIGLNEQLGILRRNVVFVGQLLQDPVEGAAVVVNDRLDVVRCGNQVQLGQDVDQ